MHNIFSIHSTRRPPGMPAAHASVVFVVVLPAIQITLRNHRISLVFGFPLYRCVSPRFPFYFRATFDIIASLCHLNVGKCDSRSADQR